MPPPADPWAWRITREPATLSAGADDLERLRGTVPGWVWRAAAHALIDDATPAELMGPLLPRLGLRALTPAEAERVGAYLGRNGGSTSDALHVLVGWSGLTGR